MDPIVRGMYAHTRVDAQAIAAVPDALLGAKTLVTFTIPMVLHFWEDQTSEGKISFVRGKGIVVDQGSKATNGQPVSGTCL